MSKIYAVRVGAAPGIYDDWATCQKQVSGYSGAIFKSFPKSQREAAELFISQPKATQKRKANGDPIPKAKLRSLVITDESYNQTVSKEVVPCMGDRFSGQFELYFDGGRYLFFIKLLFILELFLAVEAIRVLQVKRKIM